MVRRERIVGIVAEEEPAAFNQRGQIAGPQPVDKRFDDGGGGLVGYDDGYNGQQEHGQSAFFFGFKEKNRRGQAGDDPEFRNGDRFKKEIESRIGDVPIEEKKQDRVPVSD